MTETEWGWWVILPLWMLTEALSSPSVISPQAWCKLCLFWLSVAVPQLCIRSDLTLTSPGTRVPKWLPLCQYEWPKICAAITQRTGAELSRKAPRLHTMIYRLGFPQKQEISHRVERSSRYSWLWRHMHPHVILIKSSKCANAIMSMLFSCPFIYFFVFLFFPVFYILPLQYKSHTFLRPLFSHMSGV